MRQKYKKTPTGIGPKERHLLTTFLSQGKQTITASDLTHQFGESRTHAHLTLSRLAKKGWLQRLHPGVYGFVPLESESTQPIPEDPLALAMDLFSPCYISGWTAAQHWDLTEQIFNTTLVLSARPGRSTMQEAGGAKYQVHLVPEDQIFGIKKIWSNNIPVLIADVHRTLIDVLNRPDLGAGGRHTLAIAREYWKSKKADPTILLEYAKKISSGTLFKRLGFTGETFGSVSIEWVNECKSHITKGISQFDPPGSKSGSITTRWNLRINVPLEEKS